MTRASLPIRYQIDNTTATDGAGTLKMICSTAISEGGFETIGLPFSAGTLHAGAKSIGSSILPIISIKLRQDNGGKQLSRTLTKY